MPSSAGKIKEHGDTKSGIWRGGGIAHDTLKTHSGCWEAGCLLYSVPLQVLARTGAIVSDSNK